MFRLNEILKVDVSLPKGKSGLGWQDDSVSKTACQPSLATRVQPCNAQKKSDAALGCLKSQHTRGMTGAGEDGSPEVGLKRAAS